MGVKVNPKKKAIKDPGFDYSQSKKELKDKYNKKEAKNMVARKTGEAYDADMAYNKNLTASARLHYLENERHDKTHGSNISHHMGGRGGGAAKKYGEPAKKYGSTEPAKKIDFDSSTDRGIETLYTGDRRGESPSKKRMGDMVARAMGNYAKRDMSAAKKMTNGENKQKYTTSGMPDHLYTEDGVKIDSRMIDEGNLSGIHRVHKDGPYVTPKEGGTTGDDKYTYNAGQKFFLKNPMEKEESAAKKKGPHRKHSKAKAIANTPKRPR